MISLYTAVDLFRYLFRLYNVQYMQKGIGFSAEVRLSYDWNIFPFYRDVDKRIKNFQFWLIYDMSSAAADGHSEYKMYLKL